MRNAKMQDNVRKGERREMGGRNKDKELHCEEGSHEQRVEPESVWERKKNFNARKYYEKLGI